MVRKFADILFILVLGSLSTSALIGIRRYTRPKIERYQEYRLKTAVLEAAGIDYEKSNVDEIFHQQITEMKKSGYEYYVSPDNRYVFEFKGRGLWGMIDGIIILDDDLETLKGIRILSQEETPGLGARIGEESYLNQFNDKKISPQLHLVVRRKATEVNEVDAVSGATLSSEALVRIINEAIAKFREVMRS